MKKINILKLALNKANISQIDAAKHFGVNPNTVNQQCNSNDLKLSTILKYAELCKMQVSELIALSE